MLPKDKVLIHAGASGVGIAAIQLARLLGAVPYITCGSQTKLDYCFAIGAEAGVLRSQDWAAYFRGLGLQFDVILDPVGAGYLNKDLSVAANGARIAIFGLLGGVSTDCNLVDFLSKNITVFFYFAQHDRVKRRLLAELETIVWPAVERGNVITALSRS